MLLVLFLLWLVLRGSSKFRVALGIHEGGNHWECYWPNVAYTNECLYFWCAYNLWSPCKVSNALLPSWNTHSIPSSIILISSHTPIYKFVFLNSWSCWIVQCPSGVESETTWTTPNLSRNWIGLWAFTLGAVGSYFVFISQAMADLTGLADWQWLIIICPVVSVLSWLRSMRVLAPTSSLGLFALLFAIIVTWVDLCDRRKIK